MNKTTAKYRNDSFKKLVTKYVYSMLAIALTLEC